MAVKLTDFLALQKQVGALTAALASKQDRVISKETDGTETSITDYLTKVGQKVNTMEQGLIAVTNEVKAMESRVGSLDSKIDSQSQLLRSIAEAVQAKPPAVSSRSLPQQSADPVCEVVMSPMVTGSTEYGTDERSNGTGYSGARPFDFRTNARVVVYGIPEPDEKDGTIPPTQRIFDPQGLPESVRSRPSVKEQLLSVLHSIKLNPKDDVLKTARRMGKYNSENPSRVRPIVVSFTTPEVAKDFVNSCGSVLRNHGCGVRWWRPFNQRSNRSPEQMDSKFLALSTRLDQIASIVGARTNVAQQGFQ